VIELWIREVEVQLFSAHRWCTLAHRSSDNENASCSRCSARREDSGHYHVPAPSHSRNKILCTKAALKQAILAAVEEAHEIGFLAGQKEQCVYLTCHGSPDRPAWMDIRLDDPNDLARNHIRFQPVVLRSLLGAGYRHLGDLRWAPSRELMNLYLCRLQMGRPDPRCCSQI